jgi:hypothetical protein
MIEEITASVIAIVYLTSECKRHGGSGGAMKRKRGYHAVSIVFPKKEM